MNTTTAPYEVQASELGRAARVSKLGHSTYKLAQHVETGQWAIWSFYSETHDMDTWYNETKNLSVEESRKVWDNYKLASPVEMALKVDDDISPEYARENEGIFEVRCYNIHTSV